MLSTMHYAHWPACLLLVTSLTDVLGPSCVAFPYSSFEVEGQIRVAWTNSSKPVFKLCLRGLCSEKYSMVGCKCQAFKIKTSSRYQLTIWLPCSVPANVSNFFFKATPLT